MAKTGRKLWFRRGGSCTLRLLGRNDGNGMGGVGML